MKTAVLFTKREEIPNKYQPDWEGRNDNRYVFSVIKALKELGHNVKEYPVDLELYNKLRMDKENIDLAFNLCDEGFFFDPELESHLPAMLDILSIHYTGSNYLCLALCLNKEIVKELLVYYGIPTPRFQVLRTGNEDVKELRFPLIVKPVHEDGSIGIKEDSVVYKEEDLRKKIRSTIRIYKQPALVEEFIDGREFNIGVIGNNEVLPISEIIFDLPPGKPKMVNYDAKWREESLYYKGTTRKCPAEIDKDLAEKLKRLALAASQLVRCRDYFRVDIRVDNDNNPFVLEVNPNPDISEEAGLAAMAKAAGYSYTNLINTIVKSTLDRVKGENN